MRPPAELPPELREQILRMCSSAPQDSVAYRQPAVRRARSIWSTRFLPTTRRLTRSRTEGNPRVATATIVLMVWIAALWVVSMTRSYLASPHSHASATRPGMRISSSSPVAADTVTVPGIAPHRPPRVHLRPSVHLRPMCRARRPRRRYVTNYRRRNHLSHQSLCHRCLRTLDLPRPLGAPSTSRSPSPSPSGSRRSG